MKILHTSLRKENTDLRTTVQALLTENLNLTARIAVLELKLEDRDRAISRSKATITRLKDHLDGPKDTTKTKPATWVKNNSPKKPVKKV